MKMPTKDSSSIKVHGESSSQSDSHRTDGMALIKSHGRDGDEFTSAMTASHPSFSPTRTSPRHDQGSAAEHLVMHDLLRQGYQAALMPPTFSYDILVDLGGEFCRIQVKSTLQPKVRHAQESPAYIFEMRRFGNRGSYQARTYSQDEFDIVACVALDIGEIGYLAHPSKIHIKLKPPGTSRHPQETKPFITDLPFTTALNQLLASKSA